MDIDFDELVKLFKEDPNAFEAKRIEAIEELLQTFKERGRSEEQLDRYRSMIWQQDQVLAKYKDPIARFNKLVELFFEQHEKFRVAVNNLNDINNNKPLQVDKKNATIISFNGATNDKGKNL